MPVKKSITSQRRKSHKPGSQAFKSLPCLRRQQPGDLAESQPPEGGGGNPEPQSHRPCQGTKPWLPCDLGKTPRTCQAPPHSHLKERRWQVVVSGYAIWETEYKCLLSSLLIHQATLSAEWFSVILLNKLMLATGSGHMTMHLNPSHGDVIWYTYLLTMW